MYDNTIEEEITERDQALLDIIEAGNDLTEQQAERILEDSGLADDFRMLHSAKALTASSSIDTEKKLAEFKQRINGRQRRKRVVLWSAVAAVAAAVACIVIWLPTAEVAQPKHDVSGHIFTADMTDRDVTLSTSDKTLATVKKTPTAPFTEIDADNLLAESEPDERVTLQVPLGKSAHLTLPDGSQVWLYPDSRLKFPHRFASDKREVVLEGQAYFSVVRNTAQPFLVCAGDMTTKVLGTEFVVSAYAGAQPQVTLVSGKVEVGSTEGKAVLSPGKQVTMDSDGSFRLTTVDTEQYVHWREGYFYFDNSTIHDILLSIGRNYNVCVICPDPATLDKRVRFIADRNEPLRDIISRLNSLGDLRVDIESNMLVVK